MTFMTILDPRTGQTVHLPAPPKPVKPKIAARQAPVLTGIKADLPLLGQEGIREQRRSTHGGAKPIAVAGRERL